MLSWTSRRVDVLACFAAAVYLTTSRLFCILLMLRRFVSTWYKVLSATVAGVPNVEVERFNCNSGALPDSFVCLVIVVISPFLRSNVIRASWMTIIVARVVS